MKKEKMKKIIINFCYKTKGNWNFIYEDIKNREPVTYEELERMRVNVDDFISIIDENFPNNFKSIYMPPLILYTKGNKNLIIQDKEIISLWTQDFNLKNKYINELSEDNIYAVIMNENNIQDINSLINKGMKLIIVANEYKNEQLKQLELNDNTLFISEIPNDISYPYLDEEQTVERILQGVSYTNLILDKEVLENINIKKLLSSESKNICVMDYDGFDDYDIENLKIKLFK